MVHRVSNSLQDRISCIVSDFGPWKLTITYLVKTFSMINTFLRLLPPERLWRLPFELIHHLQSQRSYPAPYAQNRKIIILAYHCSTRIAIEHPCLNTFFDYSDLRLHPDDTRDTKARRTACVPVSSKPTPTSTGFLAMWVYRRLCPLSSPKRTLEMAKTKSTIEKMRRRLQ